MGGSGLIRVVAIAIVAASIAACGGFNFGSAAPSSLGTKGADESVSADTTDTTTNEPDDMTGEMAADPTTPETYLLTYPDAITIDTTAIFAFASNLTDATFQCRGDGDAFGMCTSPKEFNGLALGNHEFTVRAVASPEIVDRTPETWAWEVTNVTPAAASQR